MSDLTADQLKTIQPGPDLDALVAEIVMGWRKGAVGSNYGQWLDFAGMRQAPAIDTDDYYHPESAW